MYSFYKNIPPIKDFSLASQTKYYVECPQDWSIIITDVAGSTLAIENGKYRDVNLVGASAIAAVQNILDERDIPFTFGGDGATILVPNKQLNKIEAELSAVQKMALDVFKLELRIGIVPVEEVRQKNGQVLIGKYQVAPGNSIALFFGNGFSMAEKIVKSDPKSHGLKPPPADQEKPDLKNLSCRWAPIPSQNGLVVSILVMARPEQNAEKTYSEVMEKLEKFIHEIRHNPIRENGLKLNSFAQNFSRDMKLQGRLPLPLRIMSFLMRIAFLTFTSAFHKNLLPKVDIKKYIAENAANSDYKKLDVFLKMIIDCSQTEFEQMLAILTEFKSDGKIFFGLHRSKNSVMTCIVHEMDNNQHIHFVDGGDGGYALAAKMLKEQIKSAST